MTLGELIDAALEPSRRSSKGTMEENVIFGCSYDIEKALPALWNAEVLEIDAATSDGAIQDYIVSRVLELGLPDRVRVIVVPLE